MGVFEKASKGHSHEWNEMQITSGLRAMVRLHGAQTSGATEPGLRREQFWHDAGRLGGRMRSEARPDSDGKAAPRRGARDLDR